MCGNGTRCVGRFLVDHGYSAAGEIDLEVFGRVVHLSVGPELVSVDMGEVSVEGPVTVTVPLPQGQSIELDGTKVSVGNPHVVIVVDDLDEVILKKWGPAIETNAQFPQGTNVHFVEAVSDGEVNVLHWERGAGATLACGSGTCAVAAALLAGAGSLTINVPGGTVSVEIDGRGHAIKTGPAVPVFTGTWG
jgi:diaminopimelate epimerase